MELLKYPKLIEVRDLYLIWTLAICKQIFLLLLVIVKVKNNCFVSICLPASRDAHVPEKSDSEKLHHNSNEQNWNRSTKEEKLKYLMKKIF